MSLFYIYKKKLPVFFFFLLLFCAGFNAFGQLLQQDFSSSTTVSNYVSATTPNNGQWNAISTSGSGVVLSINTTTSNKLRFDRTAGANAGSFSRTTDFSPTPSTLMYRMDLALTGTTTAVTSMAVFQVGSGYGTANSSESNANTYGRFALNTTTTNGTFSIRDITGGTNSSNLSGTQTILWVLNNSGSATTYRAPDGTDESIANDKADLWAGTTRLFNDVSVETSTQTMTDLKFAITGSSGIVDIDNVLIDPIPPIPTSGAASNITSNSFQANWTAVTGVTGYRVDVATDAGFTSILGSYNNVYVSGQATNSLSVTGLTPGTQYWYRIRSANQYTVGEFASGNSASQTLTTTAAKTYTWTGASGVNLNWTTPANWDLNDGTTPSTALDNAIINSNVTITAVPTATIGSLTINTNKAVVLQNSASSTTLTISNVTGTDLTVGNGSSLTLDYNSSNSVSMILGTSATADISGTLKVNGTGSNVGASYTSTGTTAVSSTGTYQHARDGGTIPAATWTSGSTCYITGVIDNVPTGLAQTFHHFTWECGAETGTLTSLGGNLTTINGNLKFLNTNSNVLKLQNGCTAYSLTVNGNFEISGSTTSVLWNASTACGSAVPQTLTVNGNFLIGTGAMFDETLQRTGSELNIIYGGTSNQTVTISGTLVNSSMYYTINSGAIVTLASDLPVATGLSCTVNGKLTCGTGALPYNVTGAGSFTLGNASTATLEITNSSAGISSSGTATGNILTTGGRTFNTGANYTYIGNAAQITGTGLPTSCNNLTINNSNGVTLTSSCSVTNNLVLNGGKLITTLSTILNIANTATTAITGTLNSSNCVKGPMTWQLLNNISADGTTYFFPLADGGDNYRPFELVNIRTGSTTPVMRVTVAQTGAITFDLTMSSVNPRSWLLETVSGNFNNSTIRLTESSLVSSNLVGYNATTQSGDYSAVGGNNIGTTITSNTGMQPGYYAVGDGCTPPSQASGMSASSPQTDGFNINWTAGTGNGTMIVLRQTTDANALPALGTSYTPNLAWTSAGQINSSNRVVFRAAATSAGPVTGLTAETQYTITGYEYYTSGNCYNRTSPPSATIYTLSTEPSTQPGSGFTSTSCSTSAIDLTFPAASGITNADGYIILMNAGSTPSNVPTDGQSYSVNNGIGGDTVVAIINSTSATTATISGLNAGVNYYFTLIPYNASSGAIAQTFNYKTNGIILSTNYTTFPVATSTTSTVTTDAGYSYTSNIDYTQWQSATISNTGSGANGSVGVQEITISDGGASADADAFATLLAGITFTYTGTANTIRQAALFTNSNAKIRNATSVGANTITFSGLPDTVTLRAPDNDSIKLILRVTFNSTVTDNDKLVFTVNSVTSGSNCTYSQLTTPTAVSDNNGGNDKNRIEVTADRLRFTTQPVDQATNTNLATVTLKTVDALNNVDLDASKTITLTTTGTGITSSSPYSLTSGVLNISDIQFNTAQNNIALIAATTGLSYDNDDTSSLFNIIDVAIGTYRSGASGNWTTIAWQQFQSGTGWTSVSAPTSGTTDSIMIDHNVVFNTSGAWTLSNLIVRRGGTFTQSNSNGVTFTNLIIRTGGTYNQTWLTTISSTGNFEIEDSATYNLNYHSQSLVSNLWQGAEKFHPASNFVVQDINGTDASLITGSTAITKYTNGTYSAPFGNLIVDFASGSGNFAADFQLVYSGFTGNLTHGNLIFKSPPSGKDIRFVSAGTMGSSTAPDTIGGNLIIYSTFNGKVTIRNDNFNAFITVRGDLLDSTTVSTSAFRFCSSSSGSMTITLNVDGNITLFNNGNFYFNGTSGTGTETATLNLKGDLTVPAGGLFTNFNTSNNGKINFIAPGDGSSSATTQTIAISSTGANRNKAINFNINNGAYVQLANTLELGTNAKVTDSLGATFDFGFIGTTPQIVTAVSGSSGTAFESRSGSYLKITSTDGIDSGRVSTTLGNVQGIAKSNRDFSSTGTFWYIGKANQVTGNGIGKSTSARQVICDLAGSTLTLTPTDSFGVTKATTASTTGGKLDIRRGQFTETSTAYISGSDGTLYMSPGTLYKIVRGHSDTASSFGDLIPRMSGSGSGTFPYILSGGTIELAGSGTDAYQTLRADNSNYNYKYVKYSGANTFGTDFKSLSSQTTIDSAVIITGSTVVDCIGSSLSSQSFIGNGGLVMDGGRIRIKNVSSTQPELVGDNVAYNITGGTVEFYGSSATQQQQIRGNYTSASSNKPKITYYNMEVNAAASNFSSNPGNADLTSSFNLTGTLNVNAPAVLRMDASDFIDSTGTVNINAHAGLFYGNSNGITTIASGAFGNIRVTGTRSFSTGANYGFIGSGNTSTGNGLPSTTNGLFVYKTNTSDRITLSNTVRADSVLKMLKGHIITGTSNLIELGKDVSNRGALNYTTGYIVGKMRRWFNGTNSNIDSSLFPMGQDTFSNLYNRHYNIQFTSAPTTGGYLDVNFNNNSMGTAGLPIMGIPAVGTCTSSFNVSTTEDEGYWIASPQTSTLGDGAYTLAITGENFSTITDLCQLTLLKRVGGGNWTAPGTHLQPTGSTANATVSRSGLSGFSNFGFGGGPPNPLPVELVSFIGNCIDEKSALITWRTASEQNSKEFILQHSADGTYFTNVKIVPASGFSNAPKIYSAVDSELISGNSYYRLIEADYNGKQDIFQLIQLRCDETKTLHVFYNEENIIVELNSGIDKEVVINVFDVSGKLLHSENKFVQTGYNKLNIDFKQQLADGIYFVQVVDGTTIHTTKVIAH